MTNTTAILCASGGEKPGSARNRGLGLLALMLTLCLAPVTSGQPPAIDSIMLQDPEFVYVPPTKAHWERLAPLWRRALERPEEELMRAAADTIAIAAADDMPGLQAAADELIRIVEDESVSPRTARAAAGALVVLDISRAAEPLARRNASAGPLFAQVAEPALIRWGHQPTRDEWLARLATPDTPRSLLLTAIEGAGQLKVDEAAEQLQTLLQDPRQVSHVRLAAARSLASLRSSGLTPQAVELQQQAGDSSTLDRMLAVTLLDRHADPAAVDLLLQLAEDPAAVVAGGAMRRLFEIDPRLLDDLAPRQLTHRDVNIRRVAVRTLVTQQSVQAVQLIAPLLDDRNPSLRREVAESMLKLADSEGLRPTVIESASGILGIGEWRGLEQAILVLSYLDHKPAVERYIELLEHKRPEVYVTATWGLRRLGLPETLPVLFAIANDADRRLNGEAEPDMDFRAVSEQLSQCFQAFGQMDFREAEPLMLRYVPKDPELPEASRGAAIWSLGYFHAGEAPADLTGQMIERLRDVASAIPESNFVRRMCAVSLGRMKSESALPALREFRDQDGPNHEVGFCCAWAIWHITGEEIPPQDGGIYRAVDWFLVPLDDDPSD